MKERPEGFLSEENIDHDGEIFDYIRELHDYLWAFINAAFPGAGGHLCHYLDNALGRTKYICEQERQGG